jgi:hypothetical protein
MRTSIAIVCLIASAPAFAQEMPGLDLSDPPREQPPAEQQAQPRAEDELPPVDLSAPRGDARTPTPTPGAAVHRP